MRTVKPRREIEALENRLCLTTLLFDDFQGGSEFGINHDVAFSSHTAIFASHDDGIEYDGSLFPPQGTIELRLRVDEVGAYDRRLWVNSVMGFSTLIDSTGADGRSKGDVFLTVGGKDGKVGFALGEVGGSDAILRQVSSETSIVDGRCHTVGVSYGSLGIKLYIDGIVEDQDDYRGARNGKAVSLGDFAERFFSDQDFAFGFIGEVDAIRTSSQQEDVQLDNTCDPRAGDTDLDGDVDFTDFLTLSANYGKEVDAVWQDGDFDVNGTVDFADFLLLSVNYEEYANVTERISCGESSPQLGLVGGLPNLTTEVEFGCNLKLEFTNLDEIRDAADEDGKLKFTVALSRGSKDTSTELRLFPLPSNPLLVQFEERSVTIPVGQETVNVTAVILVENITETVVPVVVRAVSPRLDLRFSGSGVSGGTGGGGGTTIWTWTVIWI